MASPIDLLLIPSIYEVTVIITALSAYYVYRQQTTAYNYTKGLLIGVHVLFEGIVLFEILRNFYFSSQLLVIYTVGGTDLVLVDVLLLTLIAITVFMRPSGTGYSGIVREMLAKKKHAVIFLAFTAYVVFVGVYLVAFQPFAINIVQNLSGFPVYIAEYTNLYLDLLVVILLLFIGYPSALLLSAARKVRDRPVKRTLVILPIVWVAIGADLLAFNGYLLTSGIDATPFGYLIAAAAFGTTAFLFRRASLLAGFFEPLKQLVPAGFPFSVRLGAQPGFGEGKAFLLEVNPSLSYEQVVKDFAIERISRGSPVFAFTSRGTPIYNALLGVNGVRFYTMSGKVSYPKPTGQYYEVLVPQTDQAVLLDVIEKTKESTPEGSFGIIFDSISDTILYTGFESTYKFLKQANEILNDPRVSALFLLTADAHDHKTVTLVKSLFPNHLAFDASGLRITRQP